MESANVIVRVPADVQEDLLALLRTEEGAGAMVIKRVSSWRSAGVPWAEILIALSSAGSLTAIGAVVKAWLDRTRGKLEIVSEQTGNRVVFDGPLDQLPAKQIEALFKPAKPVQTKPDSPSRPLGPGKKGEPT
jgi:hypothetical protein